MWKAVASVALAITIIAAAQLVAPLLAPGSTCAAAVVMTAQAASPATEIPAQPTQPAPPELQPAAESDTPATPVEEAPTSPMVRDIAFHGLEHVSPDLIAQIERAVPHTLVGNPYDKDAAQNATDVLRNTGWYANVESSTEPMEGGVRLLFTVKENPIVLQVVVTGFEHLTDPQQQSVLNVAQSLRNLPVNNNAETMGAQKLRDLGWFRSCECTKAAVPGGVSLNFAVAELPVVTGMAFTGNTKLTAAELATVTNIPVGEVLNRNKVMQAGINIAAKYSQFGYTQARVTDLNLTDANVLQFTIEEKTISQIIITGNIKTPEATIRNALTFHVGDVYNSNAVQESVKKLDDLGVFKDVKAVPSLGATPGALVETISVTERDNP